MKFWTWYPLHCKLWKRCFRVLYEKQSYSHPNSFTFKGCSLVPKGNRIYSIQSGQWGDLCNPVGNWESCSGDYSLMFMDGLGVPISSEMIGMSKRGKYFILNHNFLLRRLKEVKGNHKFSENAWLPTEQAPLLGLSTCILSFNIFSRKRSMVSSDTHLCREAKNLTRKGTNKGDNSLHWIFLDSPDIFFKSSCLSLFCLFVCLQRQDQHLRKLRFFSGLFLFFFFLDICALTLLKRFSKPRWLIPFLEFFSFERFSSFSFWSSLHKFPLDSGLMKSSWIACAPWMRVADPWVYEGFKPVCVIYSITSFRLSVIVTDSCQGNLIETNTYKLVNSV